MAAGPTKIIDLAARRRAADDGAAKRLFFGVALPEATRAAAAELIASFKIEPGRVSWVKRDNLHLTLKFLGDAGDASVPAIAQTARKAICGFAPLKLEVEGVGVFPNKDRPRVIWLGMTGETERLAEMEAALSAKLEPLGFSREERPFTAHITAGRIKSDAIRGQVLRVTRACQKAHVGAAPVTEVILYESRLNPGGSIYIPVEVFPLTGAPGPA